MKTELPPCPLGCDIGDPACPNSMLAPVSHETANELGALRYIGCQPTDDQCVFARTSELYKHGDMVLIWVNEGDLCMHELVPAVMPEFGKLKDQLAAAQAEVAQLAVSDKAAWDALQETNTLIDTLVKALGDAEHKLCSDQVTATSKASTIKLVRKALSDAAKFREGGGDEMA